MPDNSQFIFPPWLIPAITGVIGFISAIILERFKNRVVFLKFKRNIFQVATTTNHRFWGKIEVLYNNRKSNHLSLITIEIKNDSNIDLENVNVDLWIDETSQILAHQANYIESGNLIRLEEKFESQFNEVLKLNDADTLMKENSPEHQTSVELLNKVQFITSNLKLNLPVFNRNTSITIQVLAENFKSKIPFLSLGILHKSCKLIPDEGEIERERKQNRGTAIIWLILFGVGIGIIYWKFRNHPLAVIWTGILGFFSLYIAIGLYQLIRSIKKVWS